MIPSLNHWIAEPPTKTDPSIAYTTSLLILQAMVDNIPFSDLIKSLPVFIRTKHPVPYVELTIPLLIQCCPNKEACWSPATPVIGISSPKNVLFEVRPNNPLESLTSGRISFGTSKIFNNSSSQHKS